MRLFRGEITTDVVGASCEFEFEVEDDATEQEIEETAKETAFNLVDWWYEEVKEQKGAINERLRYESVVG